MSYTIYTTEAIVMRIIPSGEANLDVVFFTRKLGKITARVQSGRASHSKMRMHITRFSHVILEIIRGKNTWRCVGIEHLTSLHQSVTIPVYRVVRLAEFLIQGEEPHYEIFELLKHLIQYRYDGSLKALEIFGVIVILQQLGYWEGDVFPTVPTPKLLEICFTTRHQLIPQINASISATQIMVY